MPTGNSRLRVQQEEGGVVRIGFQDRNILDEANIQQIGDEITQLVEQSANPRVLICFENVEHLSSAALGALITVNNKIRQKGGQLRLSNIDDQIREVFEITKLDKLFQIHPDVERALASFQ